VNRFEEISHIEEDFPDTSLSVSAKKHKSIVSNASATGASKLDTSGAAEAAGSSHAIMSCKPSSRRHVPGGNGFGGDGGSQWDAIDVQVCDTQTCSMTKWEYCEVICVVCSVACVCFINEDLK
jgi:hypothetical protein